MSIKLPCHYTSTLLLFVYTFPLSHTHMYVLPKYFSLHMGPPLFLSLSHSLFISLSTCEISPYRSQSFCLRHSIQMRVCVCFLFVCASVCLVSYDYLTIVVSILLTILLVASSLNSLIFVIHSISVCLSVSPFSFTYAFVCLSVCDLPQKLSLSQSFISFSLDRFLFLSPIHS